jgi:hypothetical protein
MSIRDEELQNEIEKAGSAGDGLDAQSYKRVFNALKKEPEFQLSGNFADKVIARIEVKKESSGDFFWIASGIVAFVVTAIVSVVLTDFKFTFGAFKFITGYPGLIVFGIAFILGLHWLDKKLVRPSVS